MSLALFTKGCPRKSHSMIFSTVSRRGLATHKQSASRLATAIILNRAPILTRTPTPFEKAFYDYEARLQRVLHNPFPSEFYFKPGSVLEAKFNQEESKRERRVFGKGFGRLPKASGSTLKPQDIAKERVETGARISEADKTNDVKSLDRQGERNLYLVVKRPPGSKYEWQFPHGELKGDEFLHQAVRRHLNDAYGIEMNTWIVSNKPIGHLKHALGQGEGSEETVFFFKAHIFAGQVKPVETDAVDFAWLTKEEIKPYVSDEYWEGTKDMLSDF